LRWILTAATVASVTYYIETDNCYVRVVSMQDTSAGREKPAMQIAHCLYSISIVVYVSPSEKEQGNGFKDKEDGSIQLAQPPGVTKTTHKRPATIAFPGITPAKMRMITEAEVYEQEREGEVSINLLALASC
jgi:hypothetical protein